MTSSQEPGHQIRDLTPYYDCTTWTETAGPQSAKLRVGIRCAFIAPLSKVRGILDLQLASDYRTAWLNPADEGKTEYSGWYSTADFNKRTRVEEKGNATMTKGALTMAITNASDRRLSVWPDYLYGTVARTDAPAILEPNATMLVTAERGLRPSPPYGGPQVLIRFVDQATGDGVDVEAFGASGYVQWVAWTSIHHRTGKTGNGASALRVTEMTRAGQKLTDDYLKTTFVIGSCDGVCAVGKGYSEGNGNTSKP